MPRRRTTASRRLPGEPGVVLEVRHLRIVEAISRAGTVSGAAALMNLTQPGISHALAELEARLDTSLFQRTARGMELTVEGRRVLAAADVVLDEVRAAERDLGLARNGAAGRMHVTTQCYTCYHWLPPVLASFRAEHPNVELRIVPEAIEAPFHFLLEGRVDVAVVYEAPTVPRITSRQLFRDELVAVSSPQHPAAHKRRMDPREFADETLIVHNDPRTSAIVSDVLAPAGIQPRAVLEARLTEAIISMVAASLGVAVLARWAVAPALENGSVVARRIGNAGLFRTWYAAWAERRDGSRTLQAFVRHLGESAFPGESRVPSKAVAHDR